MGEKKGFLSGLFGGNKSGGCCNMESVQENGTEVKSGQVSQCGCSCGCNVENAEKTAGECCPEAKDGLCCIKVLGSGCKNCHALLENTKEAVKAMGFDTEVGYVTDMQEIAKYGVMSIPAIIVNEKVVSMGKVLKAAEVEKLLRKLLNLK